MTIQENKIRLEEPSLMSLREASKKIQKKNKSCILYSETIVKLLKFKTILEVVNRFWASQNVHTE